MFFQEDYTYNEIRERSLMQWLAEMEKHEDVAVRCGVPLVKSYLDTLKNENKKLKEQNEIKNQYMKKLVGK